MSELQSNFGLLSNDSFKDVLKSFLINDKRSLRVLNKPQVGFIDDHLRSLNLNTIVVETGYIDHDFSEDYASYYSRCFRPYISRCVRLHCFDKKYDKRFIESIILGRDCRSDNRLNESYLGFVVIRPLADTIIGRTCLKDDLRSHHCHAKCEIKVSFFGIPLSVSCMPFQEQDSTVAACATTALWSALNVTARLFCHSIMTPSKITLTAKERGVSLYRALPNRDGLSINEMVYAIRRVGLDVVCVDILSSLTPKRAKSIILGNIFSYLTLGIPVIIVGRIQSTNAPTMSAMHAVVANGFEYLSDDELISQRVDKDADLRRMTAGWISKIYVCDDRIGPYTSLRVENAKQCLITSNNELFNVKYLLIPLNDKIRVSYDEVWNVAFKLDGLLLKLFPIVNHIKWEIALRRSNEFKSDIRKDGYNDKSFEESRRKVLFASLPKYLWVITIYLKGEQCAIIGIDSTDAGQGLNIACAIFKSRDIPNLVGAMAAKKQFEKGRNPIYDVCLEAFKKRNDTTIMQ